MNNDDYDMHVCLFVYTCCDVQFIKVVLNVYLHARTLCVCVSVCQDALHL